MGERPVLMIGPMVRALLEGRKTQTRRVVKPQPHPNHVLSAAWGTSPDGFEFGEKHIWIENGPDYPDGPEDERRCPFGVPGDRLWVRETWARLEDPEATPVCVYRADYDPPRVGDYGLWKRRDRAKEWFDGAWSPSIHMPRWAARITLRVTSVRVERVQEISEEDARAEGVDDGPGRGRAVYPSSRAARNPLGHRAVFAELWDSINGKRAGCAWRDNPFVWAVGFEVERRA